MPAQDNALHFQDALALASAIRRRDHGDRVRRPSVAQRITTSAAVPARNQEHYAGQNGRRGCVRQPAR